MAGYSQNGQGRKEIEIFGNILKTDCLPDHISYISVLSGCSYSGLAKNLIDGMPFKLNAGVWGAPLGACQMHHNSKLAEFAVKILLELDAEDSGSHVLPANIYSDSGKLEAFADVTKMMKEKGVQKNPGCSWTEVDNRVHVFIEDDTNHPQIKDVYIIGADN
ncbi:hypothetical protein FEM48_Zijuj02G0004400 [Ziziphus jujuba var. spinosa]|uniref:Uncharacterized protein n=1 Tax=Ziziphus jujuba var. spinosa TaxID=714518 RepID=A0A978VSI9_ZIZJJ|nr:hypothetical protein FEM48_Zijuj02G0004400 [Ziziphus jujuba var. spinosa]